MKLVKSEVEEATSQAIMVSLLSLALLKMSGCPFVELYEKAEETALKLEKLRASMELEPEIPKELTEMLSAHWFSKTISAQLEQAPNKKSDIGFQIPDPRDDKKNWN